MKHATTITIAAIFSPFASFTGVTLVVSACTDDPSFAVWVGLAVTVLTFSVAVLALGEDLAKTLIGKTPEIITALEGHRSHNSINIAPGVARRRKATKFAAVGLFVLLCAAPLLVTYPLAAPVVSALAGLICASGVLIRPSEAPPASTEATTCTTCQATLTASGTCTTCPPL